MYKIDKDSGTIFINGSEFEIVQYHNECSFEASVMDLQEVHFSTLDFPDVLGIEIHDSSGFGTYLFHELSLSKSDDSIILSFYCNQPNKYWEGKWGLSTLLTVLKEVVDNHDSEDVFVAYLSIDDDWKSMDISFSVKSDFVFGEKIKELKNKILDFVKTAERTLSGNVWLKEFESDEKRFCIEILDPLLRKMKFIDVRYSHGQKEYGKDFTFSEQTKFGSLRHFGLQAKAGNIKGNVNSDIDEIIGQLNDAFSMPYHDLGANEKRHISTFIIAISGQFTNNAKDKIIEKMPPAHRGSVFFFDKYKINELIDKFWTTLLLGVE